MIGVIINPDVSTVDCYRTSGYLLILDHATFEGLMQICLFCLCLKKKSDLRLSFLVFFLETAGGTGTILGSAWTTQRL